jgi:hypothetical protein
LCPFKPHDLPAATTHQGSAQPDADHHRCWRSILILGDRFCQTLQLPACSFTCSARWAWYAFQPGHQPVCQRHIRLIKDFGSSSAFFLIVQVSQAIVFSDSGFVFVFMFFSFPRIRGFT